MLEHAGAVVFTPRERDWQKNEVIVDNDGRSSNYKEESLKKKWSDTSVPGFAQHYGSYNDGENPFTAGTGPALPAGGMIVGLDGIREAYRTGRGKFLTRATARIENVTPRKKGIVVTELPHLVGPEKVIARIKEAVGSKKLQGITDVADLTDRKHGTRLVIGVKNGYNPEAVLAQLYKHTPLEDSFGINNVSLVDGQPHTLGLRELLEVFVRHRLTVVTRRTRFRLGKRRERAHLVDGLLIAILDIDEVIAVIRSSDDAATARTRLMQVFDLTEPQAGYILELQLRRLTKFSVIELEKERDELAREIEALEAILADDVLLRRVVSRELAAVAEQFGTPRRTGLLEASARAGFGHLPVIVAKTPLSLSAEPGLKGVPTGWRLPVREVRLAAGAGYVYAICGSLSTMPGLSSHPAAERIDVDLDTGQIMGLR